MRNRACASAPAEACLYKRACTSTPAQTSLRGNNNNNNSAASAARTAAATARTTRPRSSAGKGPPKRLGSRLEHDVEAELCGGCQPWERYSPLDVFLWGAVFRGYSVYVWGHIGLVCSGARLVPRGR